MLGRLYFDDVFADLMLVHTLEHGTARGAEVGECLAAASRVVVGDAESWRTAWREQGEMAERIAREADAGGHRVTAREAYLRAVNYHYKACMAVLPTDPAYRAAFEHYRSLFRRFAELSSPPIEVLEIPFDGRTLPAYFLPPDDSGSRHPTLVIGDNTSEELYYWVGPPGVARGYNVLLVDLPGMGLNTFNGIHFRPDTEVAVGACIDHLGTRTDVDMTRVAIYGGGEPGGWVAIRAAAHEPRIAACIVDPFVSDTDAILSILDLPGIRARDGAGLSTAPGQAAQTALFYSGEPGRRFPRMVAEPERITGPLLCLNDMRDSEDLRRQAADAVAASPNPASRHRVLTPEEGTTYARQIDNFSLKHGAMFDWLDEVLCG